MSQEVESLGASKATVCEPDKGQFEHAGVEVKKMLQELKLDDSENYKVGDVIKAKVTDLDAEAKKISLSVKALLNEAARKEREEKEAAEGEVVDAYTDSEEEAPTEE